MTTFDEREQAFEAKYTAELLARFKAEMRRNHDLAIWAAGRLGREGTEAEAYATRMMRIALDAHGDAAFLDRIAADLDGVETRETVEAKLRDLETVQTRD